VEILVSNARQMLQRLDFREIGVIESMPNSVTFPLASTVKVHL
jgi:hypothetical protein